MGKEANLKALRKQLRNVINEPDFMNKIFTTEVGANLAREVNSKFEGAVKVLNKALHERLDAVDGKTKDLQKLVIDAIAKKEATPVPALLVNMDEKQ